MRRICTLLTMVGLAVAIWLLAAGAPAPEAGPPIPARGGPESQLLVTPQILVASLPVGEEQTQPLFVANGGLTATLNYTVSVLPFARTRGIVDWLDASPHLGALPSGSQVAVSVTVTPQSYMGIGSLWNASLRVSSDSRVTPTVITVPVLLEVVEPLIAPVITPTALDVALPVGASTARPLTLGNGGNATLAFTLTTALGDTAWLAARPLTGTVPPASSRELTVTLDAGAEPLGLYTNTLLVRTNSPSVPSLTAPVTLTVRPAFVYLPLARKGDLALPYPVPTPQRQGE